MKLYERFGDKGFHTTVITTFGLDFTAFEEIALPRLRGGGCHNIMLLVDARMLSYALDAATALPKYAGRHYTVTGATTSGVFHPKMIFQVGRRQGRLIVGSANMTASGLAGNRELAGLVESDLANSGERVLIAGAWQYLARVLESTQPAVEYQLRWMHNRARWLAETESPRGLVNLADGSVAAFLSTGSDVGIGTAFAQLIDERPVEKLIVMSPYWDKDLRALEHLATLLEVREVLTLIDKDKRLFPGEAIHSLPNAKVFDLNSFGQGRFIHGKLVIAQTRTADHVLYGSANCTAAALGVGGYSGQNEEACLYRRLPPNQASEILELAQILSASSPIKPAELPPFTLGEELPLEKAAARSPGRFESMFDTLTWWPPPSASARTSEVELLGANGESLSVSLQQLADETPGRVRFRVTNLKERPAFARLRFADGEHSAPAVVTLLDALREAVREARGKRAESAVLQLSEETEEGLWLLEVVDTLEAAEAVQIGDAGVSSRRPTKIGLDKHEEDRFSTLAYEQFMAGRRLRSEQGGPAGNSLAASELSLVRGYLNRILSMTEANIPVTELPDDEAVTKSLDLGDETTDGHEALERGEEFLKQRHIAKKRTEAEERERRTAAHNQATREQIVQAVERMNERVHNKVQAKSVTSFDILRLRAILSVVVAAGRGESEGAENHLRKISLRVLPIDGNATAWPRLLGKLLFTFFGGNHPAIHYLRLEQAHDKIPDDIVECWAVCFWAAQACLAAASSRSELQGLVRSVHILIEKVYRLTGLRREELEGGLVLDVFEAFSKRFDARLGLEGSQLLKSHIHMSRDLSPPTAQREAG